MVSSTDVIHVGCGILFMIAVGFLLTKTRIVDPLHLSPINRYLFRCCYIPLVLKNLIHQKLSDMNFLVFCVIAMAGFSSQVILLGLAIWPGDRFVDTSRRCCQRSR
jgi:predicted permease